MIFLSEKKKGVVRGPFVHGLVTAHNQVLHLLLIPHDGYSNITDKIILGEQTNNGSNKITARTL